MEDFFPVKPVLSEVAGVETLPGETGRATLKVAGAAIPIVFFTGPESGPIVFVQAMQHGLELNGADVSRRIIQYFECEPLLRGSLILAPIANPLAARIHAQSFPYADPPARRELNDMNRRWFQGHQTSNHVDAMVDALWKIVDLADILIDLHCHEYLYPSLVLTDMTHAASAKLAVSMGFEIISAGTGIKGQFGKDARERDGKAAVTIEMPPLRWVDHRNSQYGFYKILNALKMLEMTSGDTELPDETIVFESGAGRLEQISAKCEGVLVRYRLPGEFMKKGEKAAEIWSADDFKPVQTITAPFDSHLYVLGRVPITWGAPEQDFVNVGENVAMFREAAKIINPGEFLYKLKPVIGLETPKF